MCEIKSFEELLENYDAIEVSKHLEICGECRKKYSNKMTLLYPEIPMEKMRVIRRISLKGLFLRIAPFAAGAVLAVIAGVMFLNDVNTQEKTNGYSAITYNDCLEIMDSISDDEFIEIINSVQEDL